MKKFFIFNKEIKTRDLSWIGVDLNSNLLPGLEQGSPDVNTSISYIKALMEFGITKFYCTPRVLAGYSNKSETILVALNRLKIALALSNINAEVMASAIHMIDGNFKVSELLPCLPAKHILIEMSLLTEAPNIRQVIFDLQIKGYTVILAHPERYNFYHKSRLELYRFKELGVLFQMNLLSILGCYGKEVKRTAEFLLDNKLYDLAGTQLHYQKHLELLSASIRSGELDRKIKNYEFKNLKYYS